MHQTGEPSVEEILASIKRVIAREDRGERAAGKPAPLDGPGQSGDRRSSEDVLDLSQHGYSRRDAAPADARPLITPAVSASLRGSLDTLAAAATEAAPLTPASPASAADAGLEAMVRELLRPALSDWLDRNLPAIVERIVTAEVARIAGRQG